jgi:hypothetical protein
VTEDHEFSVTVTCSRYGMGSFAECLTRPFNERLAYFFSIAQQEGYEVDWQTGRISRPERRP